MADGMFSGISKYFNSDPEPEEDYTSLLKRLNFAPEAQDTQMFSMPGAKGYAFDPGPSLDFASGVGGGESPSFMQGMVGSKKFGPGWGGLALGAAQGLGNLYFGSKQLGLAKDQLATQKQQFGDQFNLQKQLINQDIMDKGVAGYRMDPTLNPTPEEYFKSRRLR